MNAFGQRVVFSCMIVFKQCVERGRSQVDAPGPYRLLPDGFAGVLALPGCAKGEVGIASFGFSFFGFFASRTLAYAEHVCIDFFRQFRGIPNIGHRTHTEHQWTRSNLP